MKKYAVLVFVSLLLIGCTTTQEGTTLGTLGGAAAGAIIGNQTGDRDKGALIGGALGAAGGYAVGSNMKAKFCPVCGASFDESVQYCPKDGTELMYKAK